VHNSLRMCTDRDRSGGATAIYAVCHYLPPNGNIGVGIQHLEKVLRSINGKRVIVGIDANTT
jgi:hypothetical protein